MVYIGNISCRNCRIRCAEDLGTRDPQTASHRHVRVLNSRGYNSPIKFISGSAHLLLIVLHARYLLLARFGHVLTQRPVFPAQILNRTSVLLQSSPG
jgi:hypothetical protein